MPHVIHRSFLIGWTVSSVTFGLSRAASILAVGLRFNGDCLDGPKRTARLRSGAVEVKSNGSRGLWRSDHSRAARDRGRSLEIARPTFPDTVSTCCCLRIAAVYFESDGGCALELPCVRCMAVTALGPACQLHFLASSLAVHRRQYCRRRGGGVQCKLKIFLLDNYL